MPHLARSLLWVALVWPGNALAEGPPSAPSTEEAPEAEPASAVPREIVPGAPVERGATPGGRRAAQWGAGFRMGPLYNWARDAGFDPYAGNDLLVGFFADASLRVAQSGPLSVWALVGWEVGGRSRQTAREVPVGLVFHDLHGGVEGRWQPWRRWSFSARVSAGTRYFGVTARPADLPYTLSSGSWTWSGAALGGASVLLGTIGDDAWPTARVWLTAEGGYAVTGQAEVALLADLDDEQERGLHGVTRLPSLSTSGPLMRLGVGATF